ncbi:MAG: tetratricopeptide repeat protein [Syntrophaceae bacterium]|nr:tetratricopeptide repeat protein [Syntrophaceae bacterium]
MSDQQIISQSKQKIIIYILLAIVTLAVFWQVNKFDFVNFDDNLYVSENSIIQSGITTEGIHWAFSTTYLDFWHPLTWLSYMLDYCLNDLNAGSYHLTNLILHILSALLLFWLFNRMTGVVWRSAFVAAFFALHPFHVESVAWISERKDVLSAFFWMITLCIYVYYTEKPTIIRYFPVIFSFILALMSKSIVVTLPVIMILLDYWPLKRLQSKKTKDNLTEISLKKVFFRSLWEKIPLLIFSIIFVIITVYAKYKPSESSIEHLSLSSRIANTPVSLITYLEKTFWPHHMAIFYPFLDQIQFWNVLGSSLLILVISAAVIAMAKRFPYFFVGWFWYIITILPVIGIIQIGNFAMADRYHYLPSIGIGIILAWGIPFLFKNEFARKKILLPAALAFLAVLACLSWKQCTYWKNNKVLWSHALKVTKNNYMAHNNLASALLEKGETQKAIYHYEKAISINNYAAAYYNMGIIYYRLSQYEQSIINFRNATHADPDYFAAYYNLGIVYSSIGQFQLAIKNYNEAIRIMPTLADAYNNKAYIYLNTGNNISGCSNAFKACKLGNCKTLIWANNNRLCK